MDAKNATAIARLEFNFPSFCCARLLLTLFLALSLSPIASAEIRQNHCRSARTHKASIECLLEQKAKSEAAMSQLVEMSAKGQALTPGQCSEYDSGIRWVEKVEVQSSRDLQTLAPKFRTRVERFLNLFKRNGISFEINSTRRKPERAWLMRVAFDLCTGSLAPNVVNCTPTALTYNHSEQCTRCAKSSCRRIYSRYKAGGLKMTRALRDICDPHRELPISIVWDRDDKTGVIASACDMVKAFDLAYRPSLNSNHFPGLAIDLDITNLPNKVNQLTTETRCSAQIYKHLVFLNKNTALLCYKNAPGEIACPNPRTLTYEEKAALYKKWGSHSKITDGLVRGGSNVYTAADAAINPALWQIADQCFKVGKLVDDFPHWSLDGK